MAHSTLPEEARMLTTEEELSQPAVGFAEECAFHDGGYQSH